LCRWGSLGISRNARASKPKSPIERHRGTQARLDNKSFVDKAPADVVEQTRAQLVMAAQWLKLDQKPSSFGLTGGICDSFVSSRSPLPNHDRFF
jgi:hypothetical protein